MKPFQTIVLVACGLLGLVGLFLFATFNGGGNGGTPVGPVTIWGPLPADAVYEGIENLKGTNKEFQEITYIEKDPTTLEADLAEALAGGYGPDLVIISQEQILSQAGKLSIIPYESVSERTFVSTYLPITELYLTDTGFYGFPIAVDPLVLYYNRTLLSSAGLPLPPNLWEVVTALADRLTQLQPDQSIEKSAIALGEYGNVANARAIVSLLLLQSGSTITTKEAGRVRSTLSAGTSVSGNAPAISALNFYTQFANPVKTVYSWNRSLPNSRLAFLSGDLALYLGFASERKYLAAANPNLDFDMAPIPQPGTVTNPKTYGLAYAFAIPRAAENFEGAFRTAVALTFNEPMKIIVEGSGMAPARRIQLSDTPDRFTELFYPQALVATGWLSPAPRVTDTVFSAMIENITTGRKDVAESLSSAELTLNAALP